MLTQLFGAGGRWRQRNGDGGPSDDRRRSSWGSARPKRPGRGVHEEGVGAGTYAGVAAGSAKCLKVDKKTGKVTVAKDTKAGAYKLKVKVAGDKNHKAKTKQIIVKVRVKA